MNARRLDGLVAATYTPLDDDGAVDLMMVGPMVEHLLGSKVNGLYVCGSTGEGMSLTSSERKMVAEAYVQATRGRVPVTANTVRLWRCGVGWRRDLSGNFHWDVTSTQIALWVVIVGAIAQNLSSYTADQAVVQRYMTTANQKLAARSIWTNAVLTIPATLLFFGIGTALFAFYRSHPYKLDPTITTDQIFPLFIAREMPIGIAGLIVAGVFAAAQSTVSTSMNSTATAIVTDVMRPFRMCNSEAGYLNAARCWTFLIGVVGTMLGLVFVNPDIKSLFDSFIKVIGLFMGVLGGLFVLGALTRRANATGAMIGAIIGAGVMFYLWQFTAVNGYLYTASGISTCLTVGYLSSLVFPRPARDLTGLTIYTLRDHERIDKANEEPQS